MKAGIIGLNGCGKTVIYNALTGQNADVHNSSYGVKTHVNNANVHVKDKRVEFLTQLYKPKKSVLANFEVVDVTLPPKELTLKEDTKSDLLNAIRQVDALIHVVNCFNNDKILSSYIDLETDMLLTDLSAIEKRLNKINADLKRAQTQQKALLIQEQELLQKFFSHLEQEKPLRQIELTPDETKIVKGYTFLSQKKSLVVLNIEEKDINKENSNLSEIKDYLNKNQVMYIELCGQLEMELAQLNESDKLELKESLGIKEELTYVLISKCYELLNQISFFTVGQDEVRAWTISRGDNAQEAARKIHTDISRGFIRAEIVNYDDIVKYSSWNSAKENGALRLEGKEYIMTDGDCVNFRYNV